MATSLKPRMSSQGLKNVTSLEEKPKDRWEVRLNLVQAIILWALLALVMLCVFFFGLHAGRDQGLKLALEEQGTTMLHLPLSAEAKSASGLINSLAENDKTVAASSVASIDDKAEFDFSAVSQMAVSSESAAPAKPASSKPADDSIGLLAKAASEVMEDAGRTGASSVSSQPSRTLGSVQQSSVAEEHAVKTPPPPPAQPKAALQIPPPAPVKPTVKPAVKPEVNNGQKKAKLQDEPKKPVATKGFFVQMAASDTRSEASEIAARLRASGVNPTIREAKVNNVVYFRVLVGPYDTRNEADAASKRLARHAGRGKPFVKNSQ